MSKLDLEEQVEKLSAELEMMYIRLRELEEQIEDKEEFREYIKDKLRRGDYT